MTSPAIPDNVLHFIAAKIDSVPQLEVLLLLFDDPGRAWSEDEIASRIYQPRDAAEQILQALQRRQLATAEGVRPVRYRYDAAWDVTGSLMSEVHAAYRRHLVPIATFIHNAGPASVREFARAFDLKKDR